MVENKSFGDKIFNICNGAFLLLLGIVFLYPMVYQLSISFSSAIAVLNREVWLWPVDFDLEAYKTVFESEKIWVAYGNTIYYYEDGTLVPGQNIEYPEDVQAQPLFSPTPTPWQSVGNPASVLP